MLDNRIVREIEEFVYGKPRSIQEIAEKIGRNWRTADRYVEEIIEERGSLGKRVFREGTRGALKIVYWASVEKASYSVFQEELEREIISGKKSSDFSCFDIYQHVDNKKKDVWVGQGEDEVDARRMKTFRDLLLSAKKQVLFFSGNLSFVNFNDGKIDIFEILGELVEKGVPIKVICRVGIGGEKNIRKLLSLNSKYGKELVEIRHREQPLRVSIIDGKIVSLKEIVDPLKRKMELDKKIFIFYTIRDKNWGEWFSKIFWKMFMQSIGSGKRLEELDKLKR